jgi:ubiquinone/menaquinone biosynthesis C-methylase UbiE
VSRLAPEDLIRAYPEIDFLVAEGNVSSDYMVAIHRAFYEFAAEQVAGRSVLDAGCGAGFGTEILARRCPVAVGLDLKPVLLRYARENYERPGLEFVQMDAIRLAFADGAFEAVIADELLEHLPDHVPFLDEAARVLRPGGVFVCATVNGAHSFGSLEDPLNRNHFREFDAPAFRAELEKWFDDVELYGQRIGKRYKRYMKHPIARAIEWFLVTLKIKHRIPAAFRSRVRGKITGVPSTEAAGEDFAVVRESPESSLYIVAVARGRGAR